MRNVWTSVAAAVAFLLPMTSSGIAAEPAAAAAPAIHVDVPVRLETARIVFNLDHPAFDGEQPVGLEFMRLMTERFRDDGTDWRIVAIFHGENAFVAVGDETYDRVRNWSGGNPYADEIAALQAAGVEVEMCAQTMRMKGWTNADLLPGVKVNTGANFRLVELLQEGFYSIQP